VKGGTLNVVSHTALCDQRCKLDESRASMDCRLSLSFAHTRNTKLQNMQSGKNVKKTVKTRMRKKSRPLLQRI